MRAAGPPEGRAVVLLHGYGESLESWDKVVEALHRDFRTLALDLRGHGASGWARDGDYSLEATVRDLEWVVRALGLRRFVLGGHSTGGMSALAFAATHPQSVSALVLLETDPIMFKEGLELLLPFRGPEVLDSFDAFVEAHRGGGRGATARDALATRMRALLHQREDGRWTWRQDPRLRPPQRVVPRRPRPETEVRRMVESLRMPLLLLTGERSPVLGPATVDRTLARFGSARLTHGTIPRAGHGLLTDNPDAVSRALVEFLAGLDQTGG